MSFVPSTPDYDLPVATTSEWLISCKNAVVMYHRKELMDVYSLDNKTAWLGRDPPLFQVCFTAS